MNIPKAIELLQNECCALNTIFLTDKYQAIALGIEALKRLYLQREHPKRKFPYLISGETPDLDKPYRPGSAPTPPLNSLRTTHIRSFKDV